MKRKVAEAVKVLNHDTESANRVAANQWLVHFQNSRAAWDVASAILLTHSTPDLDLHFFAAQIQNEGSDLDWSALEALLAAAKRFRAGPAQPVTQICLGISGVAGRMGWPMERLFCGLEDSIAVLEMLTVLPEGEESGDMEGLLAGGAGVPAEAVVIIVGCGCPAQGGFSLRRGCASPGGACAPPRCPPAAPPLHSPLPQPRPPFPCSLLPRQSHVASLASLLSEIGQAAPSLILQSTSEALALPQALLSCLAFPTQHWDIADSTLQFWSTLTTYILSIDHDASLDHKPAQDIFFSLYSALLDALLLRVQVDEATFNDDRGPTELPDSLVHFRLNLVELLVDICQLLTSAIFTEKLLSGGWASMNLPTPWKEVEAKLFVLNVVAEIILQEGQSIDFSMVMELVNLLPTRPSDELKGFMCIVYRSRTDVVGSYSKFISPFQVNTRPLLVWKRGICLWKMKRRLLVLLV